MMKLRAQRLEEQEAKDRATAADMSALGQGISGGIEALGGGLTKGMERSRLDAMARSLGAPGGVDEITLRKAMGQYEQNKPLTLYQEQELGYKRLAEERAQAGEKLSTQRYEDTVRRQTSEDARKAQSDALSLMEDRDKALADLAKATSKEEYDRIARRVESYHVAAKNQNLKINEAAVPQYYSPAEQQAIQTYQDLQGTAAEQGYTKKGWGGEDVETEASKAERAGRQTLPPTFGQPAKVLPAYEPTLAPAPSSPAAPGPSAGTGSVDDAPIGATGVANGKRYIKTRQGWVQQR
jgi:hypothetical protein